MADNSSTHYVATAQVHRVDIQTKVPGSGPRGAEFATKLDAPVRHVTKVAGLEIKSTGLEHLLARTEQHLKLVEDLEVIDPEAPKNVRPTRG